MAERRSSGKPGNKLSQKEHGASLRSGVPIPRRLAPWEVSHAQSVSDKGALIKRVHLESIAKKYPVFGNREMPAYAKKPEIIHTVERHKASSLEGETGSGKSTQIGQFLYEAGYRVYHIVPRKLAADGLANRLRDEMSEYVDNPNELVGIVHGDRVETHPDNKLTVMTANTFLLMEKDIREQHGDEKVAIICDETHESNLYVDVAMGVAAQAVSQQEQWRVMAVSATQNQESVGRAFSKLTKGNVPNIEIEGRPFNIEIHERPDQRAGEVYAEVGHDHRIGMIFTRGKEQLATITSNAKKELEINEFGSSNSVEFRELHRDLTPTERYHVINDPPAEGERLVIVSTPIGMSSITVPGCTLVISDGTINRKELDDDTVGGLVPKDLTQDGLMQQFGRAGRDVEGGVAYLAMPTSPNRVQIDDDKPAEAIRFVPFNERDKFGPPEIYDSLLGQVVLTVEGLGRPFYGVNKFLPNPVEGSRIIETHEGLYRMGAMKPIDDDSDRLFEISEIGSKMIAFPIRPELSRGLVEAQKPGRSLKHMARVACMAAALDAGGLQSFAKDAEKRWQELLRPTTRNDWIAQLDLVQALPGIGERGIDEKFVVDYDLNYQQVDRAMHVVRKIMQVLDIANPESIRDIHSNKIEEQLAIKDLMAGMGDNIYQRVGTERRRKVYRNIHGNDRSTTRYISDRSTTSQSDHQLVAAWPRYFIDRKTGIKNDIIELTAPANVDDVAKYARVHDTFEKKSSGQIRIDGGSAKQEYIPMFGSVQIGDPELGSPEAAIPQNMRETVISHVLNHPGNAQVELRRVASILEWLEKAVSRETMDMYKSEDAPEYITNTSITQKVVELAETTVEFHRIDQALGSYLRQGSFHISRYFDDASYEYLMSLAPEEVELSDGSFAKIQYLSPYTPYVTLPTLKNAQVTLKQSDLKLPDGRDIFVKTYDSGNQAVYLTVDQI